MTDYLELAKSIVAKAATDGAEVEVFITDSIETKIKIRAQEVEQLSQSGSRGIGVRVIRNGQTGYAYTSDFSDEGIEKTWRAALDLSQVTTADEHRKLPEPQPIADEDLQIFDADYSKVSTAQKIDFLKRAEQAALDYHEKVVLTDFCTYGDSITHTYLANSKGFASEYGRTMGYTFMFAVARDDAGDMMQATTFGASNFFKDLDAEEIGSRGGRKAYSLLGGKPVPTQKTTVVLDHSVGAQILGVISAALSAESWQRKRSFLLDRMGDTVGSSMVTLMDNGRLKGGLASAPFDAEGVPTKATRLVDEGVLENLMYDSYTAAKEGKVSTGNAQRNGHRGMPGLGASNFYMQGGNKSPEEIIKGVKSGLYVLSVMQTGGINPITGDCSMSANGIWIEDGELKQPVGGVTIATSLDDFLMNVSDVGNDMMQVPFGSVVGVPTLRIDNVTVGGAEQN